MGSLSFSTAGIKEPVIILVLITQSYICAAAETVLSESNDTNESFLKNAFVTDMCEDHAGHMWLGTEEDGIYEINMDSDKSRHFTTADGLGDDYIYAVACDRSDRIWVGHLRHGVSVYNPKRRTWKNYNWDSGPLGRRVFDIEIQPGTGDVWIATNLGISRYCRSSREWHYYTRNDGLPSYDISCLAFTANGGTVMAGSLCHGLGIGLISGNGVRWGHVIKSTNPLLPQGEGLPSDEINDIVITPTGRVFVGTNSGLAFAQFPNLSWKYIRGKDYLEKVKKMYIPPIPGIMKKRKQLQRSITGTKAGRSLLEDRVTSLASTPGNHLWIGHWQKGFEVINWDNGKTVYTSKPKQIAKKGVPDWQGRFYVKALRSTKEGRVLAGWYPGGVTVESISAQVYKTAANTKTQAAVNSSHDFPAPAQAPDTPTLRSLKARIDRDAVTKGGAVCMPDDWDTRGDWIGRYGRVFATLCAVYAPIDNHYYDTETWDTYRITKTLGPHHRDKDTVRHWIHWKKTNNTRSLYVPIKAIRRQAEWDDHGETYPWTYEGPDLLVKVKIGEGLHRLSLYFFNKDGHKGNNRHRDYLVHIKPFREEAGKHYFPYWKKVRHSEKSFSTKYIRASDVPIQQYFAAPITTSRVRYFRGGVYKNFLIRGPATYMIHIARNYSFNTILSGVFIDNLECNPAQCKEPLPGLRPALYNPPAWEDSLKKHGENALLQAAVDLWGAAMGVNEPAIPDYGMAKRALRAAVAAKAPELLISAWRWRLRIWTEADRLTFKRKMNQKWILMAENKRKAIERFGMEDDGKTFPLPFPDVSKRDFDAGK